MLTERNLAHCDERGPCHTSRYARSRQQDGKPDFGYLSPIHHHPHTTVCPHAGRPASRFAVFRLARTASDCARIREVLQACDLIMPESRRGSEGSMARPLGTAARARSSRQSLGETTWFAPGQWLTHKNTITALRLTPVTHARVTRRVTPPAGYLGLPPPTLSTTATALVPSTLDGTLVRRVRPASDRRALQPIPVQVRTRTGRAERQPSATTNRSRSA